MKLFVGLMVGLTAGFAAIGYAVPESRVAADRRDTVSVFDGYEFPPAERGGYSTWRGREPYYRTQEGENEGLVLSSDAFEEFKAATPNKPAYWEWWKANQAIRFPGRGEPARPLTPPPAKLARLKTEYDYHRAAQAFHLQWRAKFNPERRTESPLSNSEVEAIFRKLAYTKGGPRQVDAMYSLPRFIGMTRGDEAQWEEFNKLETHPATRELFPQMEDVRFIQMTKPNEHPASPALRENMLAWLLTVFTDRDRLRYAPEAYREAIRRASMVDASIHLNLYFTPHMIPRDWWLDPERDPEGSRSTALKKMAATNTLLAWMQVEQTVRPSPIQWLYHGKETPDWKDTARLATYSFEQYKAGKGREWLVQAAELVRPEQPEFAEITAATEAALTAKLYMESVPYFHGRVWQALVWQRAQAGYLDAALELFRLPGFEELDFTADSHLLERNPRYKDNGWLRVQGASAALVGWYIHQGNYADARKTMRFVMGSDPYSFPKKFFPEKADWDERFRGQNRLDQMIILAETPQQLYAALARREDLSHAEVAPVLNLLPREALYALAADKENEMLPKNRVHVARMALARAWLLDDDNLLKRTAKVMKTYSEGDSAELMQAVQGDDIDMLRYVLSHPRTRPMAAYFNDYWGDRDGVRETEIDGYNRNDNNWWCRYKPDFNREVLVRAWSLWPELYWDYHSWKKEQLPEKFAAARGLRLVEHPLTALVDEEEQEDIAAIPQAPEYLTKQALARHNRFTWWGLLSRDDERIAETLHLAVRTTRYGCTRDGSHQSYSFDAFRALHKDYPDSPWTKATPYWFE